MTNIHKTAILNGNINIEEGVEVGPYCVLDGDITIQKGTVLKNHVNIAGHVTIGENNIIYPFSSIGTAPQDLKFNKDSISKVQIGNNNIIREYVSINGGTDAGTPWKDIKNTTVIGNNCYLYISSHIGHDVILENNVTVTNYSGVAGHVLLEDNVIIGGLSGIHQNIKIGKFSMIGGMCGISNSVPPFCLTYTEEINKIFSLNLIGLRRAGFSNENISLIKKIYNIFYKDKINSDILKNLDLTLTEEEKNHNLYKTINDFFLTLNQRGYVDVSKRITDNGF